MIESGLPWEFGVYGDEEEELAAKSEDPIMKKIWDDKIPVVDINIKKVFNGTHAIINWVISEKQGSVRTFYCVLRLRSPSLVNVNKFSESRNLWIPLFKAK